MAVMYYKFVAPLVEIFWIIDTLAVSYWPDNKHMLLARKEKRAKWEDVIWRRIWPAPVPGGAEISQIRSLIKVIFEAENIKWQI